MGIPNQQEFLIPSLRLGQALSEAKDLLDEF
jgi:hypothetical protein